MATKFSNLFFKTPVKVAKPLTESMEFKPHGGVAKPVAVPADNSTKPGPTPVGHVEHPAPGLKEPGTTVVAEPIVAALTGKALFSETQIAQVVEALKQLKAE
jgi:hypothetical protein